MKEFKRPGGFGGGRSGGGFNRGGSGSRDGGGFRGGGQRDFSRPTQMHEATCAQCKKVCEVPFLPNGRKPVYCKDCFENEKNDAPQNRSFSRDSSGPRPSYRPDREQRPERSVERPGGSDLRTQVDALNAKLDTLLQLVKSLQHTPAPKKEEHKKEVVPAKKAAAKTPEKKAAKKAAKK